MAHVILYPNGEEAAPCIECGTMLVWIEAGPACLNCGAIVKQLRAQLIERDAQCAAMRSALMALIFKHPERSKSHTPSTDGSANLTEQIERALASDAGTTLLSELQGLRDSVAALSKARDHWKREAEHPRNETDDGWRPGDG